MGAYNEEQSRAFMAFETATDASKFSSSVIAYIMHYICTVHTVS